jgi:tight adherence protein B
MTGTGVVLVGCGLLLVGVASGRGTTRRRPVAIERVSPAWRWPTAAIRSLDQRVGVLRRRRERQLVAALPAFIDALVRSLRSGLSLHQALAETQVDGPLAEEVQRLVDSVQQGRSLAHTIVTLPKRFPRPEVRLVATALAVASVNESGAAIALDGVGSSLRDLAAVEAEIRALTAQARASMYVTASLPVAFFSLTALVDPRAAAFLFTAPFGRFCLGLGLALDVLGFLWMRRLVRALE